MTDYRILPGELPKHYDRPDDYDYTMEPPFNRRVRHGKMDHPYWTWAFIILFCFGVWGGLGYLALNLMGVVE